MTEADQHQRLNYDQFIAFLLIYASHVDLDFSTEEKIRIIDRVGKETYSEMYDKFLNMTDFESFQLIMSYKHEYFSSAEQKEKLVNKLKMLFYADEDYSEMEVTWMEYIRRLM